jgi:hypothetical protein
MKTRDILLIAGLGYLAWYLLKGKKPLMKEDLSAGKGGSPSPTMKGSGAPQAPATLGGFKKPVTVDDLSLQLKPVMQPQEFVMPTLEKPALREPIEIPATNLIPNVYDRGVNAPLPMNDKYYASFAGTCSSSMENACKCASTRKDKYQIDLPKLP